MADRTQSQQFRRLLEYTDRTSWLRVFSICSLSFMPSFAFAILLELLPLQPPDEGWQANWAYWVRFFLACYALSFGVAIQTSITAPASNLTVKHAVFIAFGAAIGFVLQLILLAQYWCFPVPFSIICGFPAWDLAEVACAIMAMGVNRFRQNPIINQQMSACFPLAWIQVCLLLLYPAYHAVFLRLHGLPQLAFILILPVMKFSMKAFLSRFTDKIPAASAFGLVTVELFDALYLFKCMQAAGSMLSGAGLITVDLVQNVYHLRSLHRRARSVKRALAPDDSPDANAFVQKITTAGPRRTHFLLFSSQVIPLEAPTSVAAPIQSGPPELSAVESTAPSVSSVRLDQSVQALVLECEHIVLVEFIECAVPMFYAAYLTILFHLPNAKYYPEMQHLDAVRLAQTARNIALYATLELVSILYMHVLLRWKFGISALHLLANLLERDNVMLQGVFLTWVIIMLQFTLEHSGTVGSELGLG